MHNTTPTHDSSNILTLLTFRSSKTSTSLLIIKPVLVLLFAVVILVCSGTLKLDTSVWCRCQEQKDTNSSCSTTIQQLIEGIRNFARHAARGHLLQFWRCFFAPCHAGFSLQLDIHPKHILLVSTGSFLIKCIIFFRRETRNLNRLHFPFCSMRITRIYSWVLYFSFYFS